MAIKLKKQASGSVAVPPASHIAFFIDQNGNPALMDGDGVVSPAVTVDGSPLSLDEQETDPAPEANKVKLYSKDVDGISEFFARDDQGNVIQITSGGALNAGGGGSGTFFDDSQSASLNQTVLTGASFSWNTGINVGTLPTNGMLTIHVETQSVNNSGEGDIGFLRAEARWNTPPVLPASLDASVDGIMLYFVFGTQLDDIRLNALGELILDLTENKGYDTQFILKLTVSPVRALPFPPL